jgi:hypothetical protein
LDSPAAGSTALDTRRDSSHGYGGDDASALSLAGDLPDNPDAQRRPTF